MSDTLAYRQVEGERDGARILKEELVEQMEMVTYINWHNGCCKIAT